MLQESEQVESKWLRRLGSCAAPAWCSLCSSHLAMMQTYRTTVSGSYLVNLWKYELYFVVIWELRNTKQFKM
jgi:hypothetical protein